MVLASFCSVTTIAQPNSGSNWNRTALSIRLDTRPLFQELRIECPNYYPKNSESMKVERQTKSFVLDIRVISSGKRPFAIELPRLQVRKSEGEIQVPIQHKYDNLYNSVLPLDVGENHFEISYLFDEKVIKKNIVINRSEEAAQLFLVSVGIPYDKSGAKKLDFTVNDAEAIESLFKTQTELYTGIHSRLLTTYNQTRSDSLVRNIFEFLFDPAKTIQPKDVIVLFLSGHGDLPIDPSDTSTWTVLCSNFDSYLPNQTSINYQRDILAKLDRINCKKVILLDACHSGGAHPSKSNKNEELLKVQERIINQPPDYIVIMSSQRGEESWELPKAKHGAFTKALIDGFAGEADLDPTDGAGVVYFSELEKYLVPKVEKLVQYERSKIQTPRFLKGPKVEDFPLFQTLKKQ